MEEIIKEKREKTVYIHRFHCKKCKKFLMEDEDNGDGYINSPKELGLAIYVDGSWYKNYNYYCIECEKEIKKNVVDSLISLDFKNEDDDE